MGLLSSQNAPENTDFSPVLTDKLEITQILEIQNLCLTWCNLDAPPS